MCDVNIPKKDNSNSELQHEELTLGAGKQQLLLVQMEPVKLVLLCI